MTSRKPQTRPPYEPQENCFTWVEGARGVRLALSLKTPPNEAWGIVTFVLGPEIGAADPYPRLSAALRAAGLAIIAIHPRGSGFSDGVRGDIDDYGLVLGDLQLGLEQARSTLPEKPVFLFGHSAGAALTLHIAAGEKAPLAGVIIVNPAYELAHAKGMGPSLGDYVSFAFDAVFRRSTPTIDMNRNPSAVENPADRAEGLAMQADPLVVRYFSIRYMLGQRAIMNACARNAATIDTPVLLVQGAHDALVDPRGNDEIFAALSGPDKTRLVASDGGHGSSAVETAVDAIVAWIIQHRT